MALNNESIGISAEVAIAKTFNIGINPYYAERAENDIVNLLLDNDNISKIFIKENIPEPTKHVAEKQNQIDFMLKGNKTLSVKTNRGELGKVAPQNIGQPTAETYFTYLEHYFKGFNLNDLLSKKGLSNAYENLAGIFKEISMNDIDKIFYMYWKNLFECDYYLHLFNLENHSNPLKNYIVLGKEQPPKCEKDNFSFTQSLEKWNESNTLKYNDISIGEFQVHKNRNCFKFRFNMKGVLEAFIKL